MIELTNNNCSSNKVGFWLVSSHRDARTNQRPTECIVHRNIRERCP